RAAPSRLTRAPPASSAGVSTTAPSRPHSREGLSSSSTAPANQPAPFHFQLAGTIPMKVPGTSCALFAVASLLAIRTRTAAPAESFRRGRSCRDLLGERPRPPLGRHPRNHDRPLGTLVAPCGLPHGPRVPGSQRSSRVEGGGGAPRRRGRRGLSPRYASVLAPP